MTKNEILNFRPYRTLNYWFQNIDICITINQLKDFLEFFGYKYPERLQERINNKNISKKKRGKLDDKNRKKIEKIFKNDVKLYNYVIR